MEQPERNVGVLAGVALSYTSPLVLAAVCLLLWAAGLKCRGAALRRAVAVLARRPSGSTSST